MEEILTAVFVTISAIAIFVLLSIFSLQAYKFFAPQWQDARREVFENTQSYQLGKQQEQRKLQRESDRNSENADILNNVMDHQRP